MKSRLSDRRIKKRLDTKVYIGIAVCLLVVSAAAYVDHISGEHTDHWFDQAFCQNLSSRVTDMFTAFGIVWVFCSGAIVYVCGKRENRTYGITFLEYLQMRYSKQTIEICIWIVVVQFILTSVTAIFGLELTVFVCFLLTCLFFIPIARFFRWELNEKGLIDTLKKDTCSKAIGILEADSSKDYTKVYEEIYGWYIVKMIHVMDWDDEEQCEDLTKVFEELIAVLMDRQYKKAEDEELGMYIIRVLLIEIRISHRELKQQVYFFRAILKKAADTRKGDIKWLFTVIQPLLRDVLISNIRNTCDIINYMEELGSDVFFQMLWLVNTHIRFGEVSGLAEPEEIEFGRVFWKQYENSMSIKSDETRAAIYRTAWEAVNYIIRMENMDRDEELVRVKVLDDILKRGNSKWT